MFFITSETFSSNMKVPLPRLYLGTMNFGWSQASSYVDQAVASKMLQRFVEADLNNGEEQQQQQQQQQHGYHRVDTARIYAGGKTETICGNILQTCSSSSNNILLGTKAHPSQPNGLSVDGIKEQLATSKKACQVDQFEEYYLHQPDTEHSLLESLTYLDKLVKEGTIHRVGMSNYHASEMKRAFELCREHGLTPPTVYQGLYNPLNRIVEQELLPLLKEHNCSFVAYNPLAAGLLTGKHIDPDNVLKGRFLNNPNYLPRFYTAANFQALDLIRQQCEKDNISMVNATFIWLLRHSSLKQDDGLLLGASSMKQLEENIKACTLAAKTESVLSKEMLQAFDKAYELTKDTAFPYWRSYSADMPNRANLDQGASYEAAKKK